MSKNIIWMYWHQGFDQANEVVKQCVNSWQHHNPLWKLILLDKRNYTDYCTGIDIPVEKFDLLKVQHQSDLIRTKLLIQHGGVWADPTCFCVKPLDEWLPPLLQAKIFLFHKPGRDRIVANWFIAVDGKQNQLLVKLYANLCRYWTVNDFRNQERPYPVLENMLARLINRNPWLTRLWTTPLFTKIIRLYPYMIYHYQFYHLIVSDAACRQIWDNMPKHSALEPPLLLRAGLENPLSPTIQTVIDNKQIPFFKLRWQVDGLSVKKESILSYLFKTLA